MTEIATDTAAIADRSPLNIGIRVVEVLSLRSAAQTPMVDILFPLPGVATGTA